MQNINWAIVGLGNIANSFALELKQLPNCTLHAVVSRTLSKANDFALKHKVANAYASYKMLLENEAIDAIYIATPHSLHKQLTIQALKHNKAVLCEKPLALNSKDVLEMITVAKQNNVLLMEALWTAFLPHFQKVKDIIGTRQFKAKSFGKLISLEADFGFKAPPNPDSRIINKKLGGGSLMDVGIYPIFCALSILGKPKSINAKAVFLDNGVDASTSITFNYQSFKAHLKSSIVEDTPTAAIFTFEKCRLVINSRFHEPSTVSIYFNDSLNKPIHLDFNYTTIGYSFEIEHFNNLIRNNKTESNIMDFQTSIELMQLLDTVKAKINLDYNKL